MTPSAITPELLKDVAIEIRHLQALSAKYPQLMEFTTAAIMRLYNGVTILTNSKADYAALTEVLREIGYFS